jgi:hypothetical protein
MQKCGCHCTSPAMHRHGPAAEPFGKQGIW